MNYTWKLVILHLLYICIYTFILLNYLKQHLLAITLSTQLSTIMTLSTEKLDILLTEFASRNQISQEFLFFISVHYLYMYFR